MNDIRDALLKWYIQITKFVIENIDIISKIASSLSLWYKGNKLIGIMATYVDNFLCTGNDEFIQSFLTNLQKPFAIGKDEIKCFKYLGLSLNIETNITLDQKQIDSFKNYRRCKSEN